MRLLLISVACVTLGALACSCSTSDVRPGFESTRFGDGTGPGSGSFGGDDAGSSGPGAQGGCSAATKLVYVVNDRNGLYRFAPDELTFTEVGTLKCPSGGATPNSMAVDRSGTAWINFSDGRLFKVSTEDASCEATAFEPRQHGFVRFGMAFAANAAGSDQETLFVSGILDGNLGLGLASIDLGTLKLTPIGDYDGPLRGTGAELTGTGDGKLYGFFTTATATSAEIDKTTGATSNRTTLTGVNTGAAWAFSFWGGDFWFYTASGGAPSSVTRLATSDSGQITKAKDSVGEVGRIVGAGVSTCAPTAPPK